MPAHQVRRARFQVKSARIPDMQQRQAWQKLFQDRYMVLLDQALAAWLQRHPHLQHQTLRIDRLQLDLGQLRSAMDDDTLLLSLQRQLEEQLPRFVAFSPADWQVQCHMHFLRTGAWPASSQPASALDMEHWWQQQPRLLPLLQRQLFRELHNDAVWLRLYLQHSTGFLHWLAHDLGPQRSSDATSPEAALLAILQLWLALGEPGAAAPTTRSLAALRASYARQSGLNSSEINALQLLRRFLRERRARRSATAGTIEQAAAVGQGPEADAGTSETASADGNLHTDSGLAVEQAGLVLLHPFLPALFTHMGLLQDNHFVNAEARQRAIFGLHFAATGQRSADEGALTLHKFLVNWPVSQPLPTTVHLPDEDLAQVESLLQAVIGHWTVLKNTSMDGLRETFLQRPGLLSLRDEARELVVETRAVDVLLDQLPWSLGIVQLPWQSVPLHVSWRR